MDITIMERIIFFISKVNGPIYATRVHDAIHIPLSTVTHILNVLEEKNVLGSLIQGKCRFYYFASDEVRMDFSKALDLLHSAYAKSERIFKSAETIN